MTIAVTVPTEEGTRHWVRMLSALLPGWDIAPMSEIVDPDAVRYVVAWKPPAGAICRFAKLKAVVGLGAGIDHLLLDPDLPRSVPIIRTVGRDLTQRMKEYVLLHVLRHHRLFDAFKEQQARHEWKQLVVPPATGRRVGVMGLGNLGAVAAQALAGVGFDTAGWSRSPKQVEGVDCFHGADGMAAFLKGCEILVCLLPLTPETTGILNAKTFAALAPGAAVINAARGPHLTPADLFAALDSGQLSAATLDVFDIEPLPADSPFWDHPKITVTPHVASYIDAPTGSRIVAENIRTFEETGTVADLADAGRGY